jgi:N-acetylglucosamine malate deacetylase 2
MSRQRVPGTRRAGDSLSGVSDSAAPCLLFCYAHPDDESFNGAGTAMKYASTGARIVLVTATRGQRGKRGEPPLCTPEELPALRERELRDAAAIIGIDALHLLEYQDRELGDAPIEEMRVALVTVVRRERPSVVLTFDPNGFNAHPDHVAISRFTSDAVAAAADPRWYPQSGAPHSVGRLLWTPPFPQWEIPGAEAGPHAGADFIVDVSRWRERRIAALRAHRSQQLSIDRCFFDQARLGAILDTECWRQAWGPALRQRPASDILQDL